MSQPKPKRQGPGRPPLSNTDKTVTIRAKVTANQAEAFMKLGGSKWLRAQIDMAIK